MLAPSQNLCFSLSFEGCMQQPWGSVLHVAVSLWLLQWTHGDSAINEKSTGLHELGSVLEPLIMALGLDVGKVLWQACVMLPI